MSLYIKDTSTVPREGWSYPAISGSPIKAGSYAALYGAVKRHYEVNGREAPTREDVVLWVCTNLTVPCYDGKEAFDNKFTHPPPDPKHPPPTWPLALMLIKLLAIPGDRGLGDVVARVVGPIGGDAFRRWHLLIFGRPCGCKERQEDWNATWPL